MRRQWRASLAASALLTLTGLLTASCTSAQDQPISSISPSATSRPAIKTGGSSTEPPASKQVSAAPTEPAVALIVVNQLTLFQTPSGNIACLISDANPYEEASVRCDVHINSWTPPPRPVDCEEEYGQSVVVGTTQAPHFACVGDTVYDPSARVLRYGQSLRAGPITCSSRSAGMQCVSARTGRGFEVSRRSYRFL